MKMTRREYLQAHSKNKGALDTYIIAIVALMNKAAAEEIAKAAAAFRAKLVDSPFGNIEEEDKIAVADIAEGISAVTATVLQAMNKWTKDATLADKYAVVDAVAEAIKAGLRMEHEDNEQVQQAIKDGLVSEDGE